MAIVALNSPCLLTSKASTLKLKMEEFYKSKIKSIDLQISALESEQLELEQKQKESKQRQKMEKWYDYTFESSSGLTAEFQAFVKDFKKYLLQQVRKDFELVNCSRGHFEISGFLKNKKNKKFVYFSISDVRYFPNSWYNNILIRTAENEKDYTGSSNNNCKFAEINNKAIYLVA